MGERVRDFFIIHSAKISRQRNLFKTGSKYYAYFLLQNFYSNLMAHQSYKTGIYFPRIKKLKIITR